MKLHLATTFTTGVHRGGDVKYEFLETMIDVAWGIVRDHKGDPFAQHIKSVVFAWKGSDSAFDCKLQVTIVVACGKRRGKGKCRHVMTVKHTQDFSFRGSVPSSGDLARTVLDLMEKKVDWHHERVHY